MKKYCNVSGIQKSHFYGNARTDRCIGNNNRSIVVLIGVSTVITEGSLHSSNRGYKTGLNAFAQLVFIQPSKKKVSD
ncbi:hypothetical protein B7P43_G16097 [Cryptotermes secundus]|uniref:Uncharacterized protein n=1 Tax=Cryptotermes secundus TaxID=105785 RepID=A0A2J7PL67_9NEOP|nr:hypothetical protein B7P43_G16097 [Cryptotermes secundus]